MAAAGGLDWVFNQWWEMFVGAARVHEIRLRDMRQWSDFHMISLSIDWLLLRTTTLYLVYKAIYAPLSSSSFFLLYYTTFGSHSGAREHSGQGVTPFYSDGPFIPSLAGVLDQYRPDDYQTMFLNFFTSIILAFYTPPFILGVCVCQLGRKSCR